MQILLIDIKQTFRNKRFILFTLLIPVFWYLMMVSLAKSAGFLTANYAYIWIICANIIGISGNSIITFAKKTSNTKHFYQIQDQTSEYNVIKWILTQLAMQFLLNLIISLAIILTGFIIQAITININTVIMLILLSFFGLYLSIIGFLLGIVLDKKTLDAVAMPLTMFTAILMIPFNTWLSGTFANIITPIQKAFPGYYLVTIIFNLINDISISSAILKYMLTLTLAIVPIAILYLLQKRDHIHAH
ncbi:multidrug ABC transporter permease [Leuconostoc carnosum]|uniref:multidrug ABC transporter permease n=2 Tax=Leuconostoc carnosum TaxID=1252 RepID=UPI0012396D8E|nr:multidrug ABC transporter permease [Leuconostoc carnosum]KAA8383098.1 multidrug ABC transporter permease [Leuconostoc carnosum]